jgi:probable 2-oxoglutarate dehydrogenase E1 component DHKTD1
METLGMTSLPHYSVDGTLHLVVNNQLGFTATRTHGRSSHYCTDVAKMIDAPIFHVNGDHPEDVVRATRVTMDYWRQFQNDVVVDMTCFRRWGHNEMDDPSFTQPTMYSVIDNRPTVPDLFSEKLKSEGVVEAGEVTELATSYNDTLNTSLKAAESHTPLVRPC